MNDKTMQRIAKIATYGAEVVHMEGGVLVEPEDLLTDDECDILDDLEDEDTGISKIRDAQRERSVARPIRIRRRPVDVPVKNPVETVDIEGRK